MPSGGPFRAQEVKRKSIVCTNYGVYLQYFQDMFQIMHMGF